MSKGKKARAKIHRSLREAREAELARQREIDLTIQLANLKPMDKTALWLKHPCITKADLEWLERFLGVKK